MILIFESNSEVSERLKTAAAMACPRSRVVVCRSYERALLSAMEENVDLFIVDIMGGITKNKVISGMEYVRKIRGTENYKYTDILMVGEYMDAMSFKYPEIYISGFIMLPVEYQCALNQILYLKQRRRYWEKQLWFRTESICISKRNRMDVMMLKDVIWVEMHSKECVINTCTTNRHYDVRAVKNIIRSISDKGFIKINQSDYINPNYLIGYDYYSVYLYGVDEPRRLSPIGRETLRRLFIIVDNDKIE